MKRDIDLARQLLLDIEARGADCSVSVLRTSADHDAEERVRYHLRLLVDAGYLKEIDRTASGVPCLRLTDAGHELIELTRSENRWRQAKWACQERTGGLAIAVVRGILLEWAFAAPPRYRRRRYRPTSEPLMAERPYAPYAAPPAVELEPYADQWDELPEEHVRYVRVRPKYRNGWRPRHAELEVDRADSAFEPSLPEHLI
jgi:hypothetical protein